MPIITLANTSPDFIIQNELKIRLGGFSKIVCSDLEGNFTLGEFSCVNRCTFGRYSGMGSSSYIADAVVGRYCTFGSRLSVGAFDHPTNWLSIHEFQYRDLSGIYGESILEGGINTLQDGSRQTYFGSDVWIGDNASIKRGISVGHGAIIGLGSVVTHDIEPFSIVVGNPGRVLRKRFSDKVIESLLELRWWDLDMQALRGVNCCDIESAISDLRQKRDEMATSRARPSTSTFI